MGTGAPGWELGGKGPDGIEVDGMKLVGGTPGLGNGGAPPGFDEGGCRTGPDKLAPGMVGPGGEKAEGPPMGTG